MQKPRMTCLFKKDFQLMIIMTTGFLEHLQHSCFFRNLSFFVSSSLLLNTDPNRSLLGKIQFKILLKSDRNPGSRSCLDISCNTEGKPEACVSNYKLIFAADSLQILRMGNKKCTHFIFRIKNYYYSF